MPTSTFSLISKYTRLFFLVFTLLLIFSLTWSILNIRAETYKLAELEAKTNLNKDRAFRLWATRHGGAYFIVNKETQPSIYMSHVPNRDIKMPDGRTLTLYNPATMLRDIMNDYSKLYGIKARITSDIYMNPENAPDEWEAKALKQLKSGEQEFREVSTINGKEYLRVMQPLHMEQGCMKCHAWTGLKVGDLRGATDVAVPLGEYDDVQQSQMFKLIVTHTMIWILGALGLLLLERHLRKSEKNILKDQEHLKILSQALEQSGNGVLITNVYGAIEYVNKTFERINGYTSQEVVGKSPRTIKSNLNPKELYVDMWSTISSGKIWRGEFKNRKKNGDIYWCYEVISPVLNAEGTITHYIGVVEDIEERKTAEEHIKHLAKYDPLTNLPNRRYFHQKLDLLVAEAKSKNQIFGLIYLDLDRFKMVNDSLGHSIGDVLLRSLSDRFIHMENSQTFIARIGGDEFAAISPLGMSKSSIESTVDAIEQLIKEPFYIFDNDIFMTSSIGIAIYPQDGEDAGTLIKSADMAMYSAKLAGKNRHLFFEPVHGDFMSETLVIENALRKAIVSNELFLVYQPKWDTNKQGFLGLEVLVRWNSPTLGFMHPGRFIAVAEETDLIIILGEWVLKQALQSVMELSSVIGFVPKISVNLSPIQFRNEHVTDMVLEAISAANFPPQQLELEITEGALVDNPSKAIEKMNILHTQGITFSIDDFGTGYSSMSYLKKFPVSTLKIDKSFVDDIIDDPHDRAIIQAIITLAQSFNIQTIAEGAETQEQVNILNDLGCYAIQGYWHSRPLDYDALIEYFKTVAK